MASTVKVLVIIAIVFSAWALVTKQRKGKRYNMPPRVPGLPLLGNTFQMPELNQGPWARDLKQKHGDIFTLRIGSSDWVFLSSSRIVEELFERRSAIYSSRMNLPMVFDIISGRSRIVFMPYGETWRTIRRFLHQILNTRTKNPFQRPQELEAIQLVYEYLTVPHRWFEANQRFSNSVIMNVVFGRRAEIGDPSAQMIFESSGEVLKNLAVGYNLVDGFPQLAKLPRSMQWWRPRGERTHAQSTLAYSTELERLKKSIADGTAKPCLGADLLQTVEKSNLTEKHRLYTLGALLEAGSDTSRIAINQILGAAAVYPDWAQRVQAQLDSVCGANAERLPSFNDRKQLPLVTATVKEGLRWRPMAELGIPHLCTQDDEFEGYSWPAGTVFVINAYGIALDPKEYAEPERFWPERFLNEHLDNALQGHWGFGAGRRTCVGYKVGDNNIWIAIASLLYCFNFTEDPDHPIDTMRTRWQLHDRAPYEMVITPRSEKHVKLIEENFARLSHEDF